MTAESQGPPKDEIRELLRKRDDLEERPAPAGVGAVCERCERVGSADNVVLECCPNLPDHAHREYVGCLLCETCHDWAVAGE